MAEPEPSPVNLVAGTGSRKAVRPGDVFTLELADGRHLFGRVVGADLPRGRAPIPGAYLIYLYDAVSGSPEPDLARLRPDALLAPPLFINRLPWTKGYFRTVAHHDPAPADLLERHCFRTSGGEHLDRDGQPTTHTEPCGSWTLAGYFSVDREIGRALGLPVVGYSR
ncbi:immunity 26/phosphotriesterase HocA family protein [Saccharothrix lopnurensis]|uniref:Immunity 26/phosphotriesterase HocA family protein n=1 Tax=Saccharothrix lopnurensis TaxID=1670621 RepID=A0ABW1PAJ7_9PSEU